MADYLRESGVKWLWEKIKTLLSAKQDKLVSGTNIKTINGTSLLGSGDVTISGGSGGGDFDSSGTYPNLTAGKATKLATARKIGITGGAIGTATNFDGSEAINIPVTNIYDSYIAWGGKLISAGISPLDATSPMFSANRLAFFPPENISVEYSTDGGVTWQDYGATTRSKILFTTPELGTATYKIGNKSGSVLTSDMVRVTFNGEGCYRYARLNKILLHVNNCKASAKAYITIETETYSGTIRENTYKYVQGVAGWNSIPLMYDFPFGNSNQPNVIKRLVLTLKVESNVATVPLLRNIFAIGNTSYNTQYPYDKNGHIYSFDIDQNATFPAKVTATKHVTQGGTSNQVVLGDGTLKALSDIGKTYSVVTTSADGLMPKGMYAALKDGFITNIVNVTTNESNVELSYDAAYPNADGTFTIAKGEGVEIPLATTTKAGVMSAADKAKLDKMSKIILYTLTEDEYNNHELVSLYNIILAIKNEVFNDATNRWLYDETNSYNICVKGYTGIGSDNGITYANFNVRLLTVRDGHAIGFSGFVDVDNVLETSENADCPLWTGYVCGKYHIENDGMAIHAPENSNFYVEV